MPWKCPACQTEIRHDGDEPRVNMVYRCHVCRLELVRDTNTHLMTVAPLGRHDENVQTRPRKTKG